KPLQNQSFFPVVRSYPVTPLKPFSATSTRPSVEISTGELQPPRVGMSRGVFQTISPVCLLRADIVASTSASQFWMIRSPAITGEAPVPHGPSNLPRSFDQSFFPSWLKQCIPPRPKNATTRSASAAQVAEAQ